MKWTLLGQVFRVNTTKEGKRYNPKHTIQLDIKKYLAAPRQVFKVALKQLSMYLR
jgi:hypothetical protein